MKESLLHVEYSFSPEMFTSPYEEKNLEWNENFNQA